jgi:hypothetical protein
MANSNEGKYLPFKKEDLSFETEEIILEKERVLNANVWTYVLA